MTDSVSTVYLIDDDDDVRVALSRSLRMRGLSVEAFGDATSFLNADYLKFQGCIVLDYGMPEIDGLELQERLIEAGCVLPIIFITGHGGIPQSVRATKAGALDFLEKPVELNLLLNRISTAFEIWEKSVRERDLAHQRRKDLEELTARELEMFNYIIETPSRVSNKEIALALDISARTVEIHKSRIFKKLNVGSIVELFDKFSAR